VIEGASDDDRRRDADRKRQSRLKAKLVVIPKCANRARRKRLERDDIAWLMHYFGAASAVRDPFTRPFTEQQREMITAIRNAIMTGGDQAIAATRGEGKSTLFERMLIKYTLTGVLTFSVLFQASGGLAENSLDSIKTAFEENPLLLEDYPEVCVPVVALDNTPQRAHTQVVSGNRHDNGKPFKPVSSRFKWCGKEIILPDVPGSPSAGAIIAARGLDGAVRGLKKKGKRPQVAGIDDPDTEESARSEAQAKKLDARIEKAIGGLGGQQRGIARVMLTTIQSRTSVSYRFTDPTQKPSWRGKRFRFLVHPPERTDLWEEYVALRRADWINDLDGKSTTHAHDFYVQNREAMDAGAVVANAYRMLEGELSPLQHYYNEVARKGPEAVATEYDNDPPVEAGPIESGITPHRIQRQVSGYDRLIVPPGCTVLTQGIDVRKTALHWVVRAWQPGATGFTIDKGVHEVRGTKYGSDEGVETAIYNAILERIEASKQTDYLTAGGEVLSINRALVDAGWKTDAVYAACIAAGLGVMPVMGFGKSAGCVEASFSDVQRRTKDRKPGDGWFLSRKGNLWLVCADADRWKAWEHERWMTSPGKPGCMQIYGVGSGIDRMSDDEKSHHAYARHICNEIEVEEPHNGAMRRRFKAKSDNTHWLDASYYCDVAANMEGIRLQASSATAAADAKPPEATSQGWFAQQKKR
jgi:hypothetical protein